MDKKKSVLTKEGAADNRSRLGEMLDFAAATLDDAKNAIAGKISNERGLAGKEVIESIAVGIYGALLYGAGMFYGAVYGPTEFKDKDFMVKEYTHRIAIHYNLTEEEANAEVAKAMERYRQLQNDDSKKISEKAYPTTLVKTADEMAKQYGVE